MAKPVPQVESELDDRVEALGYELVQVEWAGSNRRPILRIRVGRPEGSEPGAERSEVSVDDCVRVSRGLEEWLDGLDSLPEKYVLEVSSPGVNRPLMRTKDWSRFRGEQIAVKGETLLADRATYLEGELIGVETGSEGEEVVHLELGGGEKLEIPRADITGAHLLFRWE